MAQGRSRRAAVVVEFAVVLPVLMLLLLGIIEFSWVFHVKQCLTTASRAGARTATLPGATTTEIETDVNQLMTDMGFAQDRYPYALNITRAGGGDPYETVELTIRYADVSLAGTFFSWLNIENLTSRTAFRHEVE